MKFIDLTIPPPPLQYRELSKQYIIFLKFFPVKNRFFFMGFVFSNAEAN
jgi:hypothetical protein